MEVAFEVEEEGSHVMLVFDGDHDKLIVILACCTDLLHTGMGRKEVCDKICSPQLIHKIVLLLREEVKPTNEEALKVLLGKCVLKCLVISNEFEGLGKKKVETKTPQRGYYRKHLALAG